MASNSAAIFALNSSESKATQCIPFDVVFGRSAVLPQDVLFDVQHSDEKHSSSVTDYKNDVSCALKDVFANVIKTLELSKEKMQKQYNQAIRFNDYAVGQSVWLKVKHYKTGENRKLAPRCYGPWTVLEKLPNGVNFNIINSRKEDKVVPHACLIPVLENLPTEQPKEKQPVEYLPMTQSEHDYESSDGESSSSESDVDDSFNEHSSTDESDGVAVDVPVRNPPHRQRTVRIIPNTIFWDAIRI